jgi:uncharacterized protein
MEQAVIIYNSLLLTAVLCIIVFLTHLKSNYFPGLFTVLSLLFILLATASALLNPVDLFGKLRLLSWAVFFHFPLYLLCIACMSYKKRLAVSLTCTGISIIVFHIGAYSFLVEPHWLEIQRTTIVSPKIHREVRIAVIADLQTDKVTDYENEIFTKVAAEKPDLILFSGDYLQTMSQEDYKHQKEILNTLLRESQLNPPLGILAVQGNVEAYDWATLFRGLFVTTFQTSHSRDLGPLVITGLTLQDSHNTSLKIKSRDKFHIVLGHMPNFSQGQVDADLLLAGHTHGGQVRIPFFGPLLTLSNVPRAWASGHTEISSGKHLIVSRGLGMERGNAPRLRFNCRPELLILTIMPSSPPFPGLHM